MVLSGSEHDLEWKVLAPDAPFQEPAAPNGERQARKAVSKKL
jgi:hypothetical protein